MWIYVYPNNTETEITNAYIGSTSVKRATMRVNGAEKQVRPTWWNMDNRTLAQTSNSLSWNWWGGVFLNPDGTKIYLTQWGGGFFEWVLSTPYNISSLTLTNTIPVSAIWGWPEDIHFSTDGTKMFTVTETNQVSTVSQFNLSTAWSTSSAVLDSHKVTWLSGYCRWLYITPDGETIFVTIRNSTTFYKIPLSTAWDLSTAWTVTTGTSSIWWLSLRMWNEGKFVAWGDDENLSTLTYGTLSTPYSLATSTVLGNKNVGTARAWGLRFNNTWTICLIVWGGGSTNYVTKYSL